MRFSPERLQADRIRKPMSLHELSKASGVARDNISNIEKGVTKRPHPATLRKLADALGVEASRWFENGGDE